MQVAYLGEKLIMVTRHPSALCVKTLCRWVMRGLGWGRQRVRRGGGWGGLYDQDMWKTHPLPSHSLSLGTLLSAHTSTRQHRCCCIVWSTKAQISPTGSFYSLAIVSVCLTRPLMNAAVSWRSDTKHRTEKEPSIHLQDTVEKIIHPRVQHVPHHCRFPTF